MEGKQTSEVGFSCPHCRKTFEVPEDKRGQAVQCPHCKQHTTAPAPPPDEEEASSVIWEAIHGKREKKILLADDDEGIRRIFKRILNHGVPSARVDEASNGKEALEAFRRERYNIIIMDLRMPIMDGQEAFLQIKELCEKEDMKMPSVVFCTGYSPPGSIQKIVADDPSHALLLKPTTDICILNAVEQRL